MTLNITLLTPNQIYQSADHRLWDRDSASVVTDTSNKTVQVGAHDWEVTVTYTGVGKWREIDTSELLVQWFTRWRPDSASGVVDLIKAQGDDWLREIEDQTGDREPHTFVVAGFYNDEATATLISNYERFRQSRLHRPEQELLVSTASTASDPIVIVTGCTTPVVSRQQRKVLERLARNYPDDSARIRRAMEELNRQAARSGAALPISEECHVLSFSSSGSGFAGGLPVGTRMHRVLDGVDLGALLDEIVPSLIGGGGYQVGSSTSARSGGPPKQVRCAPRIVEPADASGWRLHELRSNDGLNAIGNDVTDSGFVVGAVAQQPGGPSQPASWSDELSLAFLPHLGGITGHAMAVNSAGTMVGEIEDADRHLRACLWTPEPSLSLLEVDGATHSSAHDVNDAGDVVGLVSFHPTEGGQIHYRPARWRHDGTSEVLTDFGADWGQATKVNAHGVALVLAYEGHRRHHLLWQSDNTFHQLATDEHAILVGLDDTGTVFGWRFGQGGQVIPSAYSPHGGWRELNAPLNSYVNAVSGDGRVAGHTALDVHGWERPWILSPGEEATLLPHFAYHHTRVQGIASDRVTGSASTDHGSHALMWSKPTGFQPAGF